MSETLKIQDLPAAHLSELLRLERWQLPQPLADSLSDFVREIGGIENARAAAEMLNELEKDD